jgi:hypothetical protein
MYMIYERHDFLHRPERVSISRFHLCEVTMACSACATCPAHQCECGKKGWRTDPLDTGHISLCASKDHARIAIAEDLRQGHLQGAGLIG